MKHDSKLKEDKLILALVRELDKLRKLTWNAPIIPLAKPYQNGWTKFYVLRDDYTRRSDAMVFIRILKEIGTECFCRKTDFIDRNGRVISPGLRVIGKDEWDKIGWPDHYKKHFRYGFHRQYGYGWSWNRGSLVEGWAMTRPFFFIEAIKPHFVTHTRTIYPDVESRKAEIDNLFTHKQYWRRYSHMKGQSQNTEKDYTQRRVDFMRALGTEDIVQYDIGA
jgi:hypothetical protein